MACESPLILSNLSVSGSDHVSAFELTLYFAPHVSNFPQPVLAPEFRSNYERCDVFLLEWALPWEKYEPELELSFNRLSRGEVQLVMSRMAARIGGELPPFDRELQRVIFRRKKRIMLERTCVEYVYIPEGDIMGLATSGRLDEATALYKNGLEQLAQNIVKRDNELIETLEEEGKERRKLFVFRGADHERHLRGLLDLKSIAHRCVTYENPPLLGRLIGSLTMGEHVDDLDVQRVIYAMTHRTKDDHVEFVSLQKRAESLSIEELQAEFHR
jgi:hypothetical protein